MIILTEPISVKFSVFLSLWWWLFLPFILWPLFWRAWLWWRREEWEKRQRYSLLEIIPTPKLEQPMASMEQVFSTWWGVYSSLSGIKNFKKKWLIGRRPYYLNLEIISIGPYPHFYLRCNEVHKESVIAALYGQFPEIIIRELDEIKDYRTLINWNLPSKKWIMYGFDLKNIRDEVYPIKTYKRFFEERWELVREEKRIDPLNTLLEGLSQLKEGKEQIWIHFRIAPVTPKDKPYFIRGKRLVDKLSHREEAAVKTAEGGWVPPEMKLTSREKEIVHAIEIKLGKLVFDSNIRVIYFAHPDVYHAKRRVLAEQYFDGFYTRDLNSLVRWGRTKSRIRHFFPVRRLYIRNRRLFRNYILRETPLFPKSGATYVLDTEELATMFHPPIAIEKLGSYLPRLRGKMGEAPIELPEEKEKIFPKEEEFTSKEEIPLPQKPPPLEISKKEEKKEEFPIKRQVLKGKRGEAPPDLPTK